MHIFATLRGMRGNGFPPRNFDEDASDLEIRRTFARNLQQGAGFISEGPRILLALNRRPAIREIYIAAAVRDPRRGIHRGSI